MRPPKQNQMSLNLESSSFSWYVYLIVPKQKCQFGPIAVIIGVEKSKSSVYSAEPSEKYNHLDIFLSFFCINLRGLFFQFYPRLTSTNIRKKVPS